MLDERVRGLRLVANTLELLDEGGAPRLRVAPPYVIGKDGQRHEATLSVKGCAVDTNPAAPWGRELLAPGASECAVEVAWNERGVSYPAVVDPSWVTTKAMNVARYWHSADLLPTGKVLVAGGFANSPAYLNSAELYDPASDTWSVTAAMTYARSEHRSVVLSSGKVLVVGGNGGGGTVGFGETYDPQTGTWLLTTNALSSPRYRHVAVSLANGTALIAGGMGSSTAPTGAEIYSPETNRFTTTGSLMTGRYRAEAVRLHDGRVLVAGGYGTSGYVNSAEIYDPATGTFGSQSTFAVGRELHTVTLLSSGKVLVFGGYATTNAGPVLYDPATNSWSSLSSPYMHRYHTATLLDDGKVLIAGGYDSSYLLRAILFHPTNNTFTSVSPLMPTARAYHAATKLPSGDVLLTGGYTGTYLDTAIRFRPDLPCTDGAECPSGFCVNGLCCDSACTDGCSRCDLGGYEGTCRVVPVGNVGDPECSPYLCNGSSATCPTSCTSNSQCAEGHFCSANQCVPKLAQGAACTAASQCQSGNCVDGYCCNSACSGPCDVCASSLGASANGTCTFLPSTQTCGNYRCSGASGNCPSSCVSDATCAPNAFCSINKLCVAKYSNGVACTSGNQCQSGNCVDGYCCNDACEGSCDRCDVTGSRGTCTVVASGNVGAPSCSPYVCNGASSNCPSSCSTDAQCASGNFCDGAKCIAKRAKGETCSGVNQCQSGFCADGYCCDKACAGACEVCSASLGASSNGTCTSLPSGTPSCGNYVCNGVSGTCPTSCTTDANCASGRYCNASRVCVAKLNLGASCSANNQCSSGNCVDGVCCDSACVGGCNRCNLSGSVGTCKNVPAGTSGQNPSCGLFTCSGTGPDCPTSCSNDSQCAATAKCTGGVCVGKLGQGQSCSENRDCLSGFCADGVCCNTACTGGGCDRCDLAGSVGTCRTVPAGQQGSPSCAPFVCSGTNTSCPTSCTHEGQCVAGYACVAGSCEPKKSNGMTCAAGNECASGHCVDGVCCDSACIGACGRCDLAGSEGTCSPVPDDTQAPACGLYRCNGLATGCPTSCEDDDDCDGHCYAGKCYGKQPLGSACSSDTACESGFCVDAACCDSACDGQCARCDAPGSVGTCTAVNGAPVGGRPACTNDGSVCGGSCDGVNMDACSYPSAGLACGESSCEDGAFAERSCDGKGSCEVKSESCAPYACGDSQCLTSCTSEADCSDSAECVGGVCKGTLEAGASCTSAGECASGFCVDGVCCQSSCTDDCKACNLSGSEGICAPNPSEPGCEGAGAEAPLWNGEADEGGCGCRVAGERGKGSGGAVVVMGLALGMAVWRRRGGAMAG